MGWLMCRLGRHAWERKRNPDMGGALAEYNQCSRCGKEQDVYGKPPEAGIGGTAPAPGSLRRPNVGRRR